ncbi:hypothetical protein GCM10011613_01770 [Cellvibrio zantedeschiae]|uniref:Tetratricopeptide repeat protein n=1 Tax=Cellvibrio zantedeschiae TaxID=1237077 RepID=A0ABQ3AQ95_9GAMM|nr:hypothetical protein [Cellvibrio zantedeschiae]GGY61963.1 hypothetical protein GCM10011613_01770 [Cellvibrio zantedeschiae]
MKYVVTLVLLMLLASCTTQKKAERVASVLVPVNEHKMSSHFQESRKLNNSDTVSQLIQTAQQDPSNSEPLYSLGYLHMQNGIRSKNPQEIQLAETYLTEVIKQFPGNSAVLKALYNIHYDNILRGRDETAFEKAKVVFMQLPESSHADINPPSLAKFGALIVQQEKDRQPNRQALREVLLDAIHESPTTDIPYIQLARLYREDRYFALAIATLKSGAENISNSAELYQAIADTYTKRADVNGCSYEHTTDIRKAGKYYQLAMPLNPENQALHFALSQSFFDQNLKQLGLNEAKIALDIKASKESISLNAQNLSSLGYHNEALALLQQAVGQGYSLSDVGYHEIYMNKGDWKNAAAGFSNYVKSREKFSVYDLIKSDLIAQQAQLQPWPISKKVSVNTPWEQALFNYWGARMSADDLKKQAHTSCEKTEYYFYTGYKDLIGGNKTLANTKFTAAINQNTYRFIERPLARYFLGNN